MILHDLYYLAYCAKTWGVYVVRSGVDQFQIICLINGMVFSTKLHLINNSSVGF